MPARYSPLGDIIEPPGYTDQVSFDDGSRYGVGVVPAEPGTLSETDTAALDHLVTRVLDITKRLEG